MWGTFGGIAFAGLLALLFEREGPAPPPPLGGPSSLAIEPGMHTVKSRGSFTGDSCGYCRFERGRTRTRTA